MLGEVTSQSKKVSSKYESTALFKLVATVLQASPAFVDSSPSTPQVKPASVPGYFDICAYSWLSASKSSLHAPLVDNSFLLSSSVSLHENPPASPEQKLTRSFKRPACSSQFFPSTTPTFFDSSTHANLAWVLVVTVLVTELVTVLDTVDDWDVVIEDVPVLVTDEVAVDVCELVSLDEMELVTDEVAEDVAVDVCVVEGLVTWQLMKLPSISSWIALFKEFTSAPHSSSVPW